MFILSVVVTVVVLMVIVVIVIVFPCLLVPLSAPRTNCSTLAPKHVVVLPSCGSLERLLWPRISGWKCFRLTPRACCAMACLSSAEIRSFGIGYSIAMIFESQHNQWSADCVNSQGSVALSWQAADWTFSSGYRVGQRWEIQPTHVGSETTSISCGDSRNCNGSSSILIRKYLWVSESAEKPKLQEQTILSSSEHCWWFANMISCCRVWLLEEANHHEHGVVMSMHCLKLLLC